MPLENEFLTFSSIDNNKLQSAKYSSYKTNFISPKRIINTNIELKSAKSNKKFKMKKTLSFFNDNDEEGLLKKRFNSENGNNKKFQLFKRNKSNIGLIKFREFHNSIKSSKNSDKKTMKYNSEINPNFINYLKEVKRYRLDSTKKPKITPFSNVFFPYKKNNISSPSNSHKYSKHTNKLEKFKFYKIECLVLDKYIDAEEYKKSEEKNSKTMSIGISINSLIENF